MTSRAPEPGHRGVLLQQRHRDSARRHGQSRYGGGRQHGRRGRRYDPGAGQGGERGVARRARTLARPERAAGEHDSGDRSSEREAGCRPRPRMRSTHRDQDPASTRSAPAGRWQVTALPVSQRRHLAVAGVLHERRDGLAGGEDEADLAAAAQVHGAVHQRRNPAGAGAAGRLDADPLGPDDDLDRAARHHVAGTGGDLDARAQPDRDPGRVRPGHRRVHQVGDAKEVGDERGGRVLVHLARRAALLDVAAVHHGDPVAHGERFLLVVRHVEEGDADPLLQLLELHLQLSSQLGVERTERLVEQQHGRLQHERAGQRHALLLAAGQLGGLAPLEADELDELERLLHPAAQVSPCRRCARRRPNATLSYTRRCGNSA